MKQLLTLGAFFLFFRGAPAPKTPAWEGTYHCFQAFYHNPRTQYSQACALEIKLIGIQEDSVVTIRNTVNRKLRVLRLTKAKGSLKSEGTVSLGYEVVDTGTGQTGILALNFHGETLSSIALIGSDLSVLLTVFYPIYQKA